MRRATTMKRLFRKIVAIFKSTVSRLTDGSAQSDFIANTAVRVAVARTIEKASEPRLAAQKIAHVSRRMSDDVQGGVLVSVDQLKPRLMSVANVQAMITSDRIMAEALIDMLASEFTERVKGGLISPGDLLRITRLFDLVHESAQPFIVQE